MSSKKMFLIIGIFLLIFASVGAVAVNDFSCQNLVQYKSLAIGQDLPDEAPFTDEIINIYLSEEIYGNLQIENKTVSGFDCTENENPSYNIYIESFDTVEDFISSDDFLTTYKEKSNSGEIVVKGVGLGKKIKLFFVKIFLKFF